MSSKFYNKWFVAFSLLTLLFSGAIWLSPYQYGKPMTYSVTINAPRELVFQFLGNSANASRWSVFVNHISTLNPSEVPDGKVGSRRRCFVNADEKGTQWDELITEVVPNEKRELSIYNLVDFPMVANNLYTEQIYESINENQCRLTFSVFYKNTEPTVFEHLKTYLAAYKICSIFERNMLNIKRIIEENA
jgi:DNA-binding transcriptional ArsR family regulator